MDDGGKAPHTAGSSGQQRPQHSRPFFYVQPQSHQPYYLYQQWHLNNPYNQYGLPGGGYNNFGRNPYMPPYNPYMQYPGLVLPPQPPMYPADYRRMYEPQPRYHPPPGSDAMYRPHYHHHDPYERREMSCSEVQTDPSDVINKVIECLGKLRTSETATERELDSGVTSQTSEICSAGDERVSEERPSAVCSPSCAASETSHTRPPARIFSDSSTTAVYDGESSRRNMEDMTGCWSLGSDELPLDSSSVREECTNAQRSAADVQFLHRPPAAQLEDPTPEVPEYPSDDELSDPNVPRCDAEELPAQSRDATVPSAQSPHPPSVGQQALKDPQNGDTISKTEYQTGPPDEAEADRTYRILKLPFEKVLTGSMFSPEPPAALTARHLSSPYYSYLSSPAAHERMSVLSPSIDELSSRDEMFSDLEDIDIFPAHIYRSRRLADVVGSRAPKVADGVEELWPVCSKKYICACCGKSLLEGSRRTKAPSPTKLYGEDDAGDAGDECKYGRSCERPTRVVLKRHAAPRKLYSVSLRHVAEHGGNRGHGKEPPGTVNQREDEEHCEGESSGITDGDLQYRTCQDGPRREDVTPLDQGRWDGGDVKARRRLPAPLPRREVTLRKAPSQSLVYHRSRDKENNEEDQDSPQFHRDRASSNRGGPR